MLLSCLLLFASFLALPAVCRAEAPVRIVHMTDPHFISPDLTDRGAAFTRIVTRADGKVMLYSSELLSAFLSEMLADPPDALIISGDLTFNGAVRSHEDLAERLQPLRRAGIPVLVLPGNHDVAYPQAARFFGETAVRVESPDEARFFDIWHAYGPDQALARDPASFSYAYALTPGLRLLLLDANTTARPNRIREETLEWARAQLAEARRAGARVISVTHQTLLRHNPLFEQGFRIANGEALREVLEQGGVRLNLSGHMHIQHIAESEGGLTEIVTSALSVQPCQYGVLVLADGALQYRTKRTDVAAWARGEGSSDPDLLRFPSYAATFFAASILKGATPALQRLPGGKEAILWMLNVNLGYFSGRLASLKPNEEALALLRREQPFWYVYFDSIRGDLGKDYNSLRIKLTDFKEERP